MNEFRHLGAYSDWAASRLAALTAGRSATAADVRVQVKALLQVPDVPEQPRDVREGQRWERDGHTWMLFPPGLSAFADWPDLAACHAPVPLLVQYARNDPLFPLPGQRQAHDRIARHYAALSAASSAALSAESAYTGRFYDVAHEFSLPMQHDAFAWLRLHLAHPVG